MLNIRLTETGGLVRADSKERLGAAWKMLLAGAEAGKNGFGWFNLPEKDITDLKAMGAELAKYRYIIVIGIGGSALGTQMLMNALLHPAYPAAGAETIPVVLVADNADSASNEAIWGQVVPAETAILAVSKSGRTLETLSNFLFFRKKLYDVIGEETEKHIYAVTDPEKGFLHAYSLEKGTRCAVLPEDTGGRYSVFTSCGLVAAAAMGMDVDQMLAGAGAMKKNIMAAPESSIASIIAEATTGAGETGRNVTVFWAYGDKLKSVGEWFAQLWGESLGKEGKGMTPQAALGSIDQHSQLQLYTSGPADKFFFFLNEKTPEAEGLSIPEGKLFDEARYLEGISSATILEYERRGVVASLKRRKLPICEIELDKTDAFCIGGLVFLLETVTALTGFMMGIDPFDQPGVEEGKNYALALCGNTAYAKYMDVLKDIAANTTSAEYTIA